MPASRKVRPHRGTLSRTHNHGASLKHHAPHRHGAHVHAAMKVVQRVRGTVTANTSVPPRARKM